MNPPIECIICGQSFSEADYPFHMRQAHPEGQLASVKKKILTKQNVPQQPEFPELTPLNQPAPQNLPPGVTPADLPDPEFLKTMQEIQEATAQPKQTMVTKAPPLEPLKPHAPTEAPRPSQGPVVEPKLTYRYAGTCKKGHPVTTLEIDVDWKHFVVAYCPIENEQVESREVENLTDQKVKK